MSDDDAEFREVTDEQRARAAEGIAQLKRDLDAARGRQRPPVTSPGKFTGPIGVDEEGDFQPPLSPEQEAHNAEVRRRTVEGDEDD